MPIQLDGPLLLAGAGNMGFALLSGWLDRGLDPGRVIVQDPAPPARIKQTLDAHGIQVSAEVRALPEPPAVILVAVKPQGCHHILSEAEKTFFRLTAACLIGIWIESLSFVLLFFISILVFNFRFVISSVLLLLGSSFRIWAF